MLRKAIIELLEQLYAEYSKFSPRFATQNILSSGGQRKLKQRQEEKNSTGGTAVPWSERHVAMSAAQAAGVQRPLLSSDKLAIFIGKLRHRRSELPRCSAAERKFQLIDENGAAITDVRGKCNVVAHVFHESKDANLEQDGKIRAQLLQQRRDKEAEKKKVGFMSRDAKLLTAMDRKDRRFAGKVKVHFASRRNGIGFAGEFDKTETGEDLLDALIEGCLHIGTNIVSCLEIRHQGSLLPIARRGGKFPVREEDRERSLLEWLAVPRVRLWISFRHVHDLSAELAPESCLNEFYSAQLAAWRAAQ